MGCASSKGDINDQHPNIFQVMNVDEDFHPISPGQIEITDTDLIFHQRGKKPTTWSLRNLRKYGFDSEIFSFECGRRCATGAGIFAFKCRKAEQLFNLLQHNIQVRNMSEETGLELTGNTATQVQRRNVTEGYLNPVNTRPPLSRPASIISNGPASPTNMATPPPSVLHEDNNNRSKTGVTDRQTSLEHSYLNSEVIANEAQGHPQYINFPANGDVNQAQGHETGAASLRNVYMNIDTTQLPIPSALPVTIQECLKEPEDDVNEPVDLPLPHPATECSLCLEDVHCYANINTQLFNDELSVPPTPTEVNYVELDLEPSAKCTTSTSQPHKPPPESPVKRKPYVIIDFKKTDALSQSINPRLDLEEGCRKTRHNSTIGDIRHSSSISD